MVKNAYQTSKIKRPVVVIELEDEAEANLVTDMLNDKHYRRKFETMIELFGRDTFYPVCS